MCWRTCFLRRMESLAKGIHYNICACARKETTEGWKKTRRYGRALHDTRVLTCLTSGSRHVRHPGLGMFDIRVSVCSTSGSRYARHPGVGHKKKAYGRNDTGRKQYRNMQRKERQTEKRQRKRYKKNNGTAKEQTQKIGERRQAARKTRSKSQPNKPVKGRRTLY